MTKCSTHVKTWQRVCLCSLASEVFLCNNFLVVLSSQVLSRLPSFSFPRRPAAKIPSLFFFLSRRFFLPKYISPRKIHLRGIKMSYSSYFLKRKSQTNRFNKSQNLQIWNELAKLRRCVSLVNFSPWPNVRQGQHRDIDIDFKCIIWS